MGGGMDNTNKDSKDIKNVITELKYAFKMIKSKTDTIYTFAL